MTQSRPNFRTLERSESDAILARNRVGRIAFTWRDQVDIEPIHFMYADGAIHGRTGAGTKLATLAHVPWVALETDEIDDLFDWRSVVVRGTFFALDPVRMRGEYDRTLALLREMVPAAMTPDDPTPERNVLFRIDVREVIGRAASAR